MENLVKLHYLEQSLEKVIIATFERCGYTNGLKSIKSDMLHLLTDNLTQEEKDKLVLVSTSELYEGSGTIFCLALKNAASLYLSKNGECSKLDTFKNDAEYTELIETIEFVRTQIH